MITILGLTGRENQKLMSQDDSKKLTSGSLECTNLGQKERTISFPISECMLPSTHFPWQRQRLGKEGHLGSATISFIYVCQHTDFSHCSSAQASIVVHTFILSHPKANIPNVWIRNFFSWFKKQKWGALCYCCCASPHQAAWWLKLKRNWAAPCNTCSESPKAINRSPGGHSHPKHAAELQAQTEIHSQNSMCGRTEKEGKWRSLLCHFMDLAKLYSVCTSCPNQHCSGHFLKDEG